ncbi:hypothetical protein B5807_00045 [Epicoccum nigrum]|uniref:Uncharacterized protein n=1 Tax=Epicoccum nigrum TaxID=105696 RepID=A0A1Y2MFS9_EPING|nr:hypothetical protein B5807_00045 [Epicoccum nigrum]
MCPIKAILILAMRSGNTTDLTFDKVIASAAANPGKAVKWRWPDRPVVCAVNQSGIDWNRISTKQRMNRALQKALKIMGVSDEVHIRPHQLRYGMASDLTVTKPTSTGHSRDQISDALSHSHGSKAADTVIRYSRMYNAEDNWSSRLASTREDVMFNELAAVTDPQPRASPPSLRQPVMAERSGRLPNSAFSEGHLDDEDDANEVVLFDIDDIVNDSAVNAEDTTTIEMLSAVGNNSLKDSDEILTSALTSSRKEFVDTFATVNITRSPHKGGSYLEYAKRSGDDKTNSVTKMTNFLFHCYNFKNGCKYTAFDVFQTRAHETN